MSKKRALKQANKIQDKNTRWVPEKLITRAVPNKQKWLDVTNLENVKLFSRKYKIKKSKKLAASKNNLSIIFDYYQR